MHILLVYSNTFTLLWPQPAGLSYVARAAREAGHRVEVVDLMFEKDPEAVLDAALASRPWDLVGLSLRNLDTADPNDSRSFVDEHAARVARAMAVAPTVIGGPAVTAAPEAMLRRTGATWAIAGQAERCFPRFLDEVAVGVASFATPGVLWREGEAIRSNPAGSRRSHPGNRLERDRHQEIQASIHGLWIGHQERLSPPLHLLRRTPHGRSLLRGPRARGHRGGSSA
ncbi:MAG: cobalamin B12-binding domain-containing protein [Pseudomonadota bacterium]